MQQNILPSIKKVIDSAQFVSIDNDTVERFCTGFTPLEVQITSFGGADRWPIEELIGLICLFNCINFCFWAGKGEEKWTIQVDGESYDGSTAAFIALEQAHKKNIPIFDPHYLSSITREQLGEILRGNIEIPLLDERVASLRQAGTVLLKTYDGNFMNIIKAANGDAVAFTNLFITHFPSFNDYSMFGESIIEFHKRAQLNTNMIDEKLMQKELPPFTNTSKLTAFADYKVPQILRKLGILEYISSLAEKIDTYTEIPANSREEIEIRSFTIWAIELIKERLLPQYPEITARTLDDHFWTLGQIKSLDDKPYHRTKTIFY